MDRVQALESVLSVDVGGPLACRIVKGKRDSTLKQQQVAWTAFQEWLKNNPDEDICISSFLKFFVYLKDVKLLSPSTIRNYRAYLALPVSLLSGLDLKDWRFKELDNAFHIESPKNRPPFPSWSLQRVLDLFKSDIYNLESCSLYFLLKKTLFLTALATANRVSEIAALSLPIFKDDRDNSIQVPVKPGFLYKNQRLGRVPPNIVIKPLQNGPIELCPVQSLEVYIRRSNGSPGILFRNSKTNVPLQPQTISLILCKVIDEADPNCLPKAHDVRKAATSLAWTRGLSMQEITRRAFWASSNTFIERYLGPVVAQGVALNTEE